MYARIFTKAAHIRRFTISDIASSGWEVREEHDWNIVRAVRYRDWHRVERAKLAFSREATTLAQAGWIEA